MIVTNECTIMLIQNYTDGGKIIQHVRGDGEGEGEGRKLEKWDQRY